MGLFDRDYDREYGSRGYDRGFRDRGGFMGSTGYDRNYNSGTRGGYGGTRGPTGYDQGFRGRAGYDQPYWGYDTWRYDEQYKSREQTDFGDPFGDRQSNTPIRVVEDHRDRGGWFGGGGKDYGRDYRYGAEFRYGSEYRGGSTGYRGAPPASDRQYGRNPVSYDPYETRGNDRQRLRGRTRGNTGDWF
jgi:hypothetical protein